ncbi:MAG TPA: tetratricopeptide repeat protein [Anaeromyxobacteraceae bacterium]|nr:tetratricopeptide repeat protein [Anaeromyxobacteraceae bacterium]
MIALLLALALVTPEADAKRARDRYEFGAYADAAALSREILAATPPPPQAVALDAWRILGLANYQLGDRAAAAEAFRQLLFLDPDQVLDPFLVPPPIVEFFDRVRAEAEPELGPIREKKRQAQEQERLAEEARRRLAAEEQARLAPPSRVVVVQEHVYLLNFMPFGIGQFQNGDTTKGIVIAVSQVVFGAINLGAIFAHNAIAQDPSRRCSVSTTTNCSNPPIPDSDRELLNNIDIVKYVSAGLFWGVYAYGVADSLVHYVPRIETEITPGKAAVKLSWDF